MVKVVKWLWCTEYTLHLIGGLVCMVLNGKGVQMVVVYCAHPLSRRSDIIVYFSLVLSLLFVGGEGCGGKDPYICAQPGGPGWL